MGICEMAEYSLYVGYAMGSTEMAASSPRGLVLILTVEYMKTSVIREPRVVIFDSPYPCTGEEERKFRYRSHRPSSLRSEHSRTESWARYVGVARGCLELAAHRTLASACAQRS